MSTFPGIVAEIPGISVDRFDGENLESSAFFLSHCHTDHMEGLDIRFFNSLRAKEQFIYCTPLSKLFLEGKFRLYESQADRIRTVVPCSPIVVDYVANGEQESITVVAVNAGHCPGSVMFIFEREDASILYTGDFRISPSDLPRLKPLHYQAGVTILPKRFNAIYLDTTFLSLDYKDFPSRQDSLSEITRVARNWINRDSENVVILECPAYYGSEFIFMELKDSLQKRVHVKPNLYQNFSRIPELERCITDDGNSTPIHACMVKNLRNRKYLACRDVRPENILTIVISAMRWKGRDLSETISESDPMDDAIIYVWLSMHSSYNEIKAFIDYFNADKLVACVQPKNCVYSMQDFLNGLTKKAVEVESLPIKTHKLESLMSKRFVRPQTKSQYFSDDSSD